MALDEAKGREELAEKLAVMPGMTTDQARNLLAAAPDKSGNAGLSMNNAFDAFMQSHSPGPHIRPAKATVMIPKRRC
nr:scaffold protein [Salmonella sp. NCTC 7297]